MPSPPMPPVISVDSPYIPRNLYLSLLTYATGLAAGAREALLGGLHRGVAEALPECDHVVRAQVGEGESRRPAPRDPAPDDRVLHRRGGNIEDGFVLDFLHVDQHGQAHGPAAVVV